MRGGYGGSKRLIVRHNRSLCDAMRQCKNSRPLRFCENSLTSEGKLTTFPPTEIPAAQICMRATALYNCMTAMRSCWTKAVHTCSHIRNQIFAGKIHAQPAAFDARLDPFRFCGAGIDRRAIAGASAGKWADLAAAPGQVRY